jgi:hypothetical protein
MITSSFRFLQDSTMIAGITMKRLGNESAFFTIGEDVMKASGGIYWVYK